MKITVAMTGASGSVLTRTLLSRLEADERVEQVHFVASEHALRVAAEELQLSGRVDLLGKLLGHTATKTEQHSDANIGATIASGSYPIDAMIVLPCSMGTLARIAQGLADTLIARSADVVLKEQRKLVLGVRETPLNRIHLRNMSLAAEAGAVIYPVIPVFYDQPQSTADMVAQYVDRLLAHVGLRQPEAYVWKG